MHRIEVFADVLCPFTHVGLRRLSEERHARAARVSLRVRAWPLEWINGAPLGPDLVAREVEALRAEVAPELFAGFDPSLFPLTSIPAFGVAAAAYAVDDALGAAVSMALRDAFFEHGADIADIEVLEDIARKFGVELPSPDAADKAVRADWELGRRRAVRGSPHFFVGDRDWFCPSLAISHKDDKFDVEIAEASKQDFYAAAFS